MNKCKQFFTMLALITAISVFHPIIGAAAKAKPSMRAHPFRDLLAAIKTGDQTTVAEIIESGQIKATVVLKAQDTSKHTDETLPQFARRYKKEGIAQYIESVQRRNAKTAACNAPAQARQNQTASSPAQSPMARPTHMRVLPYKELINAIKNDDVAAFNAIVPSQLPLNFMLKANKPGFQDQTIEQYVARSGATRIVQSLKKTQSAADTAAAAAKKVNEDESEKKAFANKKLETPGQQIARGIRDNEIELLRGLENIYLSAEPIIEIDHLPMSSMEYAQFLGRKETDVLNQITTNIKPAIVAEIGRNRKAALAQREEAMKRWTKAHEEIQNMIDAAHKSRDPKDMIRLLEAARALKKSGAPLQAISSTAKYNTLAEYARFINTLLHKDSKTELTFAQNFPHQWIELLAILDTK